VDQRPSVGGDDGAPTELKIPHVIQGRTDKIVALQELAARLGLSAAQCVYMGDDRGRGSKRPRAVSKVTTH
jgi:hypothetical protein